MSGRDNSCFKCGRGGHWARECHEDGDRGSFGRDRGGPGMRMDFRSGGRPAGQDKCYKCNRPGHFARECRMDQDRCYRCNLLGHVARDCSKEIESGACYNCKSSGHVQRDCPEPSVRPCYRCGETGHIAKECDEAPNPPPMVSRSIDDRKCYGCGGVGHISKECPTAARQSGRDCYNYRGFGPIRRPFRDLPRTGSYLRRSGPYQSVERRSGGGSYDRDRRSRSPVARRSRSPVARRSRSPVSRRSRSPVARRSPERNGVGNHKIVNWN